MSFSDKSLFVAGDEDLELHQLFSFNDITEAAAADSPLTSKHRPGPPLGSPFAGPYEALQGQLSWLSPSHATPTDGLDVVNFDDFLTLNESSEDVLTTVKEPSAPPLPELAKSCSSQNKSVPDPEPAGHSPEVAQLEAARNEIAQLKAAMVAESLQPEVETPSGRRQNSSSSPYKRKLDVGKVSPPKRQTTDQVGPIEALWSSKMNQDVQTPLNLASPSTPKPSSPRANFTAHSSVPHTNSPDDCTISPENLHSIQAFLNDNPELVYGTSHSINISTAPSNVTMAHTVDTKATRSPPKSAPKRASKTTIVRNSEITKKPKAAPKKKQHRRKASAPSNAAPSLDTPPSHRSIDELLAANFYSLNAQEKLRIMLPMLRNLDPRELEKSLAELPSIQAKGAGHEVRVARAIHESPPTPEDDDLLATKLTFGTPSSPTPVAKRISASPPAPILQASPLSSKVTHVKISEKSWCYSPERGS